MTTTLERETRPIQPKRVNEIRVMVGGQGGDGTLTVISLLARCLKLIGLHTYDARNVLSRIRGGHADGVLRGSVNRVLCSGDALDALVAFDEEAVEVGSPLLEADGVVIFDSSRGPLKKQLPPRVQVYQSKLSDLAGTQLKKTLLKNTISFAILSRALGLKQELVERVVRERYQRKGGEVLEGNMAALQIGFRLADEIGVAAHYSIPEGAENGSLQVVGDEAIGIGFIVGGGRFYAGYPITPASEVLDYLSVNLPKFGGAAIQAEDEISAINMAIGAAVAGVRSMTATSGPGQDLMTEGLGQAAEAEIPVVIVDVQRSGPSTGMPTKHEQSDLNHVVFAGHGDFPRLVIAPADVTDCFYLTVDALNLAEKYQMPVFILIDQALAQNSQSVPPFDLSKVRVERGKLLSQTELDSLPVYKRYEFSSDGISRRTVPGMSGGFSQITGNEHNEWGMVSVNTENREKMMRKRMLKVELAKTEMPRARFYGSQDAKIGFVSFGSNVGPILEAMDILAAKNLPTKFLLVRSLHPLHEDELVQFLDSVDTAFVVECNLSGQLAGLIRREVGFANKIFGINRFDGHSFRPSEIAQRVLEELGPKTGGNSRNA